MESTFAFEHMLNTHRNFANNYLTANNYMDTIKERERWFS